MSPSQSTGSVPGSSQVSSLEQSTLLQAELRLIASSGGFAAPALLDAELATVIEQVLADPLTLRKVSDRVFELLCQDLRRQQERRPHV